MNFNYNCLQCNINQALKVSEVLKISTGKQEVMMRRVLRLMSEISYDQPNPAVMARTWALMSEVTGNDDPYKLFKVNFNESLHKIKPQIKTEIERHDNLFHAYMYGAILGNIIDLGPGHEVEHDLWLQQFTKEMSKPCLQVDESEALQTKLATAKKLLYIGDNCGEIVLDYLFIDYIRVCYPQLDVTFCVREAPVLNDITMEDAIQVEMDQLVKVITTGGKTPGVVMTHTSEEFRAAFDSADVIISKGQGNYEGLSELIDDRIHFLFMVKCQLLADDLKVPMMSRMCSTSLCQEQL